MEAPTSFVFRLQLEGGSKPLISQDTTQGKLQLPNSLATTRQRLQPPMFSDYNLREAPTPQFSGYNKKEARTLYVLWL